jgi:hypothetical protein
VSATVANLVTAGLALVLVSATFVAMIRVERRTHSLWAPVGFGVVALVIPCCLLALHSEVRLPPNRYCMPALHEVVDPDHPSDFGPALHQRCQRESAVRVTQIATLALGTTLVVNLGLALLLRRRDRLSAPTDRSVTPTPY